MLCAEYCAIYNSNQIDQKILTKGYSKQQIDFLKKSKTKQVRCLNLVFSKEVTEFKHPYFSYLFKTYNYYDKTGNFPNGKELNKQNNKLVETYDIFTALFNETELNRLKEQEKKNNVKQGRNRR